VGREDSDINLPDPTMSIHHFEIEKRGGEFFIRDLKSTNHTKVNGTKITSTTLESGDRIQAGLTVLVFLAG
jgi:pSer/pThr/pTyr-binding forkhead associated (FHA) protein